MRTLNNCLYFILSCIPVISGAQPNPEKGLPFITNYLSKDYKASPQNWGIIEDNQGIMYFANSFGLLEYDGVKWRRLALKGLNFIVRTLDKDKSGRIFFGAGGDFGYLATDSLGQNQPISLLQFVPATLRQFNDVWSVYATEEGVYFQARERIFRLVKKGSTGKETWEVKSWEPKSRFMYSFFIDNTYYIHQQGLGLFRMEADSLKLIPGSEFLGNERIQVFLPYESNGKERVYLLGQFSGGLHLFNGKTFQSFPTEADPIIKYNTLYKATKLNDGSFALATSGKGLAIIDKRGKIIQLINRDVGLQDESVYGVYSDRKGSLWLGLDNGIARVENNSPFTQFTIQSGITTSALSLKRFQGELYLGTTNGLLRFNRKKVKFEQIKEIPSNQIFDLITDDNSLIVPTDGLFYVKDNQTRLIRPSIAGNLQIVSVARSKKYPNILFACGDGIFMFSRKKVSENFSNGWEFAGNIPGVTEQVWSIAERIDGSIWGGTQSGGVMRISGFIDDKGNPTPGKTRVEKFDTKHGLAPGGIAVAAVKGREFFMANSAIFRFDEKQNRFFPDSSFGPMGFGDDTNEYTVVEDQKGRVWINFGKETALATLQTDGSFKIEKRPFFPITDRVVGQIIPENDGITWFATTDGLIRYDENIKKNFDEPFSTLIRRVVAGQQHLNTTNTTPGKQQQHPLTFKQNTLRFDYAAPFFEQENKTQYQTWLEGFDKDWSAWDNNSYKEYTNLPEGNYHFRVRTKNLYEKISKEAIYPFTIQPPWFRTWWAYLLYAVAGLGLIYGIVRYRTNQLHEKHKELEKTVAERTRQLNQRAEELSVINSVQEGLVRELDMQAIYELVGDRIRDLFDAQAVIIATLDQESGTEHFKYVIEKGERFFPGPRPMDKLRQHLIKTRQKIVINANMVKAYAEFGLETLAGTEPPKSVVFVPLTLGEKITSYVTLQNVDRENAFSESDIRLLETLANSMSVALENARLFDETSRLLKETEQRNAELAVINSVQESLVAQMHMQDIYNMVGEKIRAIFNAQVIDVVTYDHRSGLIEDRYSYEKGDRTLIGPRKPDGFRKHVIETKQTVFFNENLEKIAEEYDTKVLIGENPKSLVIVPMVAGGDITGMISLQNVDQENAFTDSDLTLLTTLANSMSVALENARLFDETNRLLKETEQRNAELAVINRVQESLVAQMDIHAIYELVGEKMRQIFNAQVIDIVMYDRKTGMIEDRYAYEKGDRTMLGRREPNGFRKHVIETKQTVFHNENVEEAMRAFDNKILIGDIPKSQVYVPMVAAGEVTGIISLQNLDEEHAFTDSDISLLTTLANGMSVALENARLFDETNRLLKETEQRTSELAVINSVQEGLARELDIQAIYELVGQRIQNLFDSQAVIIATFDQDTEKEDFKFTIEKGIRYYPEPRALDKVRKHLIQTRQKLVINTLEENIDWFGNAVIPGTEPSKSLVFVPMFIGEKSQAMSVCKTLTDIMHSASLMCVY